MQNVEPQEVELEPMRALHRGPDGFVSFHRKLGGSRGVWDNLFSVSVTELDSWFPEMREFLETDSYYSVHSFHRGGRGRSKALSQLPTAYRRTEGARWLNACFSDLDGYHTRPRLGFYDMFAEVLQLQDKGVIPPATIIVRSGRGLWLLWFLWDDRADTPPRAWPETVDLWRGVQRAIYARLAGIGADPQAETAVTQVTRVPGSLHSGARRRVAYWPQLAIDGRAFSYTLPELAGFLGVEVARRFYSAEVRNKSTETTGRVRGWKALHRIMLADFDMLRAVRGVFPEGMRNRAALFYAWALWKNGGSARKVDELVLRFGLRECAPALGTAEIQNAVTGGFKLRRVSYQTVADWLDITPAESAQLAKWPPATRHKLGAQDPPALPKIDPAERVERRRQLVTLCVSEYQQGAGPVAVPTLDYVQMWLESVGVVVSLATLKRDFDALGIRNPRRWHRRTEGQTDLFPA